MPKVLLDYSDGHYSTCVLNDDEATKLESEGFEVVHVDNRVLNAWHRHCDAEGTWQKLWRAILSAQPRLVDPSHTHGGA